MGSWLCPSLNRGSSRVQWSAVGDRVCCGYSWGPVVCIGVQGGRALGYWGSGGPVRCILGASPGASLSLRGLVRRCSGLILQTQLEVGLIPTLSRWLSPSGSFQSQATDPEASSGTPWWGSGQGRSESLDATGKTGSVHCSGRVCLLLSYFLSDLFISSFMAGLFC